MRTDNIEKVISDMEDTCPCPHCGRKDRVVRECKDCVIFDRPVTFYTIRCLRLRCRIKECLWGRYYPWSCDKQKVLERWNAEYRTKSKNKGKW